jgi:hypothetical protein
MTITVVVITQSSEWPWHLYFLIALPDYHTCCTYSQLYMTVKLAVSTHSSALLPHLLYLLRALYNCQTCCIYPQLCMMIATLVVPTYSSAWLSNLLYLLTALHYCQTCCTYSQLCMTAMLAVPTHSSALLSNLLYLLRAPHDYHTRCTYSKLCITITLAVLIQQLSWLKLPFTLLITLMHMPLIEKLNSLYNKIHHIYCTYSELCLAFWEMLLDTCSSSGWSSSSQYSLHSDACACYRKNQNHYMIGMETNPSSHLLGHDANISIFQAPVTGHRCLCNVLKSPI